MDFKTVYDVIASATPETVSETSLVTKKWPSEFDILGHAGKLRFAAKCACAADNWETDCPKAFPTSIVRILNVSPLRSFPF